MIGRSGRAAGLLAVALVAATYSMRPADPAAADPQARRTLAAAVERRLAIPASLLTSAARELEGGLRAGRTASSWILGGDADPGPLLARAARRWASAARDVRRARDLLASAGTPEMCPPVMTLPDLDPDEVDGAANDLADAGDRATALFELRAASERTLDALGRTLAALDAGDHAAAVAASADARLHLHATAAAYAGREAEMPTGSIWLETARALVDAAGRIAAARADGDDAAAAEAASAYEVAARDAALADRALGVALAEGAGSATGPALNRAAAVSDEIGAAAAAVSTLANDGGCG